MSTTPLDTTQNEAPPLPENPTDEQLRERYGSIKRAVDIQAPLLWDKIKEPCFTPVKGKKPFLKNWPVEVKTYTQCKQDFKEATGVGIVHFYASTACLDIDDLVTTSEKFAAEGIGIDLKGLLDTGFRIYSPKDNRAKLLYRLSPEDHQNQTLRLLKKEWCEWRAGKGCQDIIGGSEYHWTGEGFKGDYYVDDGATKLSLPELPADLRRLWIDLQQYIDKATREHKPCTPLLNNGKHSPIYWFNYEHSIEEVLESCGAFERTRKWDRWTYTEGSSEGGIVLYPAEGEGREGQLLAYMHHASMGGITGRLIDAFELQAWFDKARWLPVGKSPDPAEYIPQAVKKYANEVYVRDEEGKVLGKVHDLNQQTYTPVITNPLEALRGMCITEEQVKDIEDATLLIPGVMNKGTLNIFVAEGGTGKTAFSRYLISIAQTQGCECFYLDMDSPSSVAKEMYYLAKKEGWRYLNPDLSVGLSPETVVATLKAMANTDESLADKFFVIDTMKKFADTMSKSKMKEFNNVCRALVTKGAAVQVNAHTNKYPDKSGNLVPEGVGDVKNDCDSLFIMVAADDKSRGVRIISVLTDAEENTYTKNRFGFESFSFEMVKSPILENRVIVRHSEFIDVRDQLNLAKALSQDGTAVRALKWAIEAGHNTQEDICQTASTMPLGNLERMPGIISLRNILKKYSSDELSVKDKLFLMVKGDKNSSLY